MQGTTSGYASAGLAANASPPPNAIHANTIDKFPFASDANASDVGDLTQARSDIAGQSSSSNGYVSGGYGYPSPSVLNIIEKFPFSSDTNATDVGDLITTVHSLLGHSSTSEGYTSGGEAPGVAVPFNGSNVIQKFPFSSDTNASDVGDLTAERKEGTGYSSSSNGYSLGGIFAFSPLLNMEKFSFSTDENATSLGDLLIQGLTSANNSNGGVSSDLAGYWSETRPAGTNQIQKFSFVNETIFSGVGDLTQARTQGAGQGSTPSGYFSGGLAAPPPTNYSNVIDKFPFSTDASATDVGDLTQARYQLEGQQV